MKKAILISIRPEWVAKILNGEKTIEIRKTAPKCELPIDVYIYCSYGNVSRYLIWSERTSNYIVIDYPDYVGSCYPEYNGFVVAKFTLCKVDEFDMKDPYEEPTSLFLEKACVTIGQARTYAGGKYHYYNPLYAWHISNLEVFDEPKELSDFGIKRAPQSWQFMEVEG